MSCGEVCRRRKNSRTIYTKLFKSGWGCKLWGNLHFSVSTLLFYFIFTKTCISFVRNKKSIFLHFAWHSVLMTTRLNLPFQSNLSQFQASCLNYIIYNCALDSFFPLPFCILSPLWGKPFPSLPIFRFYYVYSSNSSASITHFYVYVSQLIVLLYSHFKFCILLSYHIL